MFAPSLLLLLFIGSLKAHDKLRCEFNYKQFCGWINDLSVTGKWHEPVFGFTSFNPGYGEIKRARLMSAWTNRELETGCFSMTYTTHSGTMNRKESPADLIVESSLEREKEKDVDFFEGRKTAVTKEASIVYYGLFKTRARLEHS
ncbi:jg8770 [Pararge aegeria aegeria]|uniref:Jg8770 protein n=1 Tax=Pararge aegeria aegeria TaxID=348720 RepID=A0A8S4S0L4_9NEOP|nr:jg8770 [Pararge aegeria aegeria]